MPFLLPNQKRQNTEGMTFLIIAWILSFQGYAELYGCLYLHNIGLVTGVRVVATRMLAINVSIPNLTVARLEQFWPPQLYETRKTAQQT